MNYADYQQFTQTLLEHIRTDERVIGLVALGSMAEQGRIPDAWSDHDFFLIVRAGTQEAFRQSSAWLPYPERIIASIRETAHGLKVIYDLPHLIEFAVFDEDELGVAKVNDYRVLYDLANIQQHMIRLSQPAPKPHYDAQRDLAMVLALLYVGAGRYARGEILSAHLFIKHHVLHHLLPLLIYLHGDSPRLDNLDPFRRIEQVHPTLADAINKALCLSPIACARALLEVVIAQTDGHITPYPTALVATVQAYVHAIASLEK